ncbi:hypothetical protein IV203_013572 [Nitzschia inconspicua]|uniref:Transposase n=2 Tax=Nitzschia inconspicua TaxID=303405 RepID=A0A9K3K7W8_9STRA|nr:hypothetical protein IV203_017539 [Nitzschia inconspicua]KAG7337308.1 hypothetical protein IV203_004899 [Nitzschia inconspicua]KAG7337424.1 hypothetical protein IV203_002687 [Nitzschia inconspicua]KAG7337617.1 hypothetical protein IV203_033462 [Nitzschia inconspicua]KAG7337872.1 hypothetical protein IV203_017749 [Nitzschia inconspicua]
MVTTRKKRVAMTEKLKKDVFTACVVRVSREILPYGSFKAVGETHKIHPRTVANLWYSTLKQIPGYQPNTPLDPVSLLANVPETAFTTKFENSGRNPKHDRDMLLQEIKNIDPTARRTIRSLAGAVGIPVMTIWRMKQSKKLKVHTMALKPKLNDDHRLNRLFHCIAKNDKNTINSVAEMTFKSMYNEIHIDEKWFFLVRDGLRCIVTQDEPPPKAISVSHKSHITKVMFLSALARPRFNHTTRQEFDGLIGIYPVGEIDMYVRASHGHQPGDLKWCNVNMDRDLYRDMLFNFVLPDVKKKMPIDNNIILQQDGAKAHLPDDDPLFAAKVTELFGDPTAVKLYTQPAQSPDLNVNDLGFFNSLQSRYYQTAPKDALELIEMVEETYKNYPAKKLNRIWLTLQSVMNQVINQRGDNDYTIPHMKKKFWNDKTNCHYRWM